jgi:hypothetical protein
MMRLALPALALLATAAQADTAMLNAMASMINAGDGGGLSSAYAACVAGMGDPEATAAYWTDEGWTRTDETEMGLIFLSSPGAHWTVTIAADGSFCEVASEQDSTGYALAQAMAVTMMAGGQNPTTNDEGCAVFALPGAKMTLTSTGQDPVCHSDTSSALRVTFD